MPTVNPIFHTLLIDLGRYGLQFLQRIYFYGFNRLMARSLKRIFEFWKQKKVTWSQIWRIRWLSNAFLSCLAKNSVTIRLEFRKIKIFRYDSGGDALHTQNMNPYVLSRPIRDVESVCYLSNANTTISDTILSTFSMLSSLTEVDGRLAWGKFPTTSRSSLNALCHSNSCVLDRVDSTKHFCNNFNYSIAVIPLETQNLKQTRCSTFFPL